MCRKCEQKRKLGNRIETGDTVVSKTDLKNYGVVLRDGSQVICLPMDDDLYLLSEREEDRVIFYEEEVVGIWEPNFNCH